MLWLVEEKETDKYQHVIMTENNLFKGYTTKDVLNYDRKQSSKLDNDGRWRCVSAVLESSTD